MGRNNKDPKITSSKRSKPDLRTKRKKKNLERNVKNVAVLRKIEVGHKQVLKLKGELKTGKPSQYNVPTPQSSSATLPDLQQLQKDIISERKQSQLRRTNMKLKVFEKHAGSIEGRKSIVSVLKKTSSTRLANAKSKPKLNTPVRRKSSAKLRKMRLSKSRIPIRSRSPFLRSPIRSRPGSSQNNVESPTNIPTPIVKIGRARRYKRLIPLRSKSSAEKLKKVGRGKILSSPRLHSKRHRALTPLRLPSHENCKSDQRPRSNSLHSEAGSSSKIARPIRKIEGGARPKETCDGQKPRVHFESPSATPESQLSLVAPSSTTTDHEDMAHEDVSLTSVLTYTLDALYEHVSDDHKVPSVDNDLNVPSTQCCRLDAPHDDSLHDVSPKVDPAQKKSNTITIATCMMGDQESQDPTLLPSTNVDDLRHTWTFENRSLTKPKFDWKVSSKEDTQKTDEVQDPLYDSGFIQYMYSPSILKKSKQNHDSGVPKFETNKQVSECGEGPKLTDDDNKYGTRDGEARNVNNKDSFELMKPSETRKVNIPKIVFKQVPLKDQQRPLWNQHVPSQKPKAACDHKHPRKKDNLSKARSLSAKKNEPSAFMLQPILENDLDCSVISLVHMTSADESIEIEKAKVEFRESNRKIEQLKVKMEEGRLTPHRRTSYENFSDSMRALSRESLCSVNSLLHMTGGEDVDYMDGIEEESEITSDGVRADSVQDGSLMELRNLSPNMVTPSTVLTTHSPYPSSNPLTPVETAPSSPSLFKYVINRESLSSRFQNVDLNVSRSKSDFVVGSPIESVQRNVHSSMEQRDAKSAAGLSDISTKIPSLTDVYPGDDEFNHMEAALPVTSTPQPTIIEIVDESEDQGTLIQSSNARDSTYDNTSHKTFQTSRGEHTHDADAVKMEKKRIPLTETSICGETVFPTSHEKTEEILKWLHNDETQPDKCSMRGNRDNIVISVRDLTNDIKPTAVGKVRESAKGPNLIGQRRLKRSRSPCLSVPNIDRSDPNREATRKNEVFKVYSDDGAVISTRITDHMREIQSQSSGSPEPHNEVIDSKTVISPKSQSGLSLKLSPRRHRNETLSQFSMRVAATKMMAQKASERETVIQLPTTVMSQSDTAPRTSPMQPAITVDVATQVETSDRVRRTAASSGEASDGRPVSSMSFARSLSYSFNTGGKPMRRPVGFDTFRQSIVPPQESQEGLEDMYLQGEMPMGTTQRSTGQGPVKKGGCCHGLKVKLKRWHNQHKHFHHEDILFKTRLKKIEGQFGSGVMSFFAFQRWVILLNMIMAFMWTCFIVVPQAITFNYSAMSTRFVLRNFIDGEKALSESWMFYGNYEDSAGSYQLAMAYVLVVLLTYFGGLFIILSSIAHAIHQEGRGSLDQRFNMSRLLFSSWDYSLQDREASRNLSLGIANAVRDMRFEIQAEQQLKSRTRKDWCRIIGFRILAWTITLILIGGGVTAIFFLISSDMASILATLGYEADEDSPLVVYGPTFLFMAINSIVPISIYKLPKMESYIRGKDELNISVGRVFILRLVNLAALVASLYSKARSGIIQKCVGTVIGQELYKLVILDTLIRTFSRCIMTFPKYYWTRKKGEFKMPAIVLAIVYRQALIWVGTLVCPVLPVVGVLSMASLFWTNYFIVTRTCEPPKKRVSHGKRSTFFMGLMAATMVMLIVPISIVISSPGIINLGQQGSSSSYCGPFGNQTMLSVFTEFRDSLRNPAPFLAYIMTLFGSPMFLIPLIFVMLAVMYFQQLRLTWEKGKKKLVTAELEKERNESKFLLKRLHLLASE